MTERARVSARRKRYPSGLHGILGVGLWGSVDQALVSVTNFVTMVLLARGVSATAFGEFTLVYTMLLFANSMQSALVTQPHNVLGSTREGEDYIRYTTSTAVCQVGLLLVAALATSAAAMLAQRNGWSAARLLYVLIPSIIAWQLQEFVRRVLYTERRLRAAFVNDLISYGGQTLIVLALWQSRRLSGVTALSALAVTSAIAAAVGAWQLRHSFGMKVDRSSVVANWHYGKWLAGGEIVGDWLSEQLYLYLVAAVVGVAAAGVLKAVVVLFGPLRILMSSLSRVLPTGFARLLATQGLVALRSQSARIFLLTAPVQACYCLFVALCAAPLLHLLYGETYANQTHILVLYAAYAWVAYLTTVATAALRAGRLTRQIFTSNVCASLVAVSLGWIVIRLVGVDGAVFGMIATASTGAVFLWRAYYRAFYGQRLAHSC